MSQRSGERVAEAQENDMETLKSAMSQWDNHDNENPRRDTPRTVVPKVVCLPVPCARLKS